MSVDPAERPTWRVDLHAHTNASPDCLTTPRDLVLHAREAGLARIAVTDHNEIEGAFAARAIDPELVIVGEEVRTRSGLELIGLFLERKIPPHGDFRDVAAAIRAQGGVVYLPHPFDARRGADPTFLDERVDCVDAVEGFNPRTRRATDDARARRWAEERGLPVGAGSDAHTLREIGRGWVRTRPFRGPEDFLAALAEGETGGRRSSPLVRVGSTWARLRKMLPV